MPLLWQPDSRDGPAEARPSLRGCFANCQSGKPSNCTTPAEVAQDDLTINCKIVQIHESVNVNSGGSAR